MKIHERVVELLDGLYSSKIVEESSKIAHHYIREKLNNPIYIPIPESLKKATQVKEMSKPEVPYSSETDDFFKAMKIYSDGVIKGPLNHIIARMLTIPRMIDGYIENYPTEEEIKIYDDPPLLQFSPNKLRDMYERYFEQAAEKLENPEELLSRFRILGAIGESVANEVESVYPAIGSTQAYELFGIFHLFPSNSLVDATATTPGVVLPTEADPLRFKDTVVILKKNLVRPTYFEMLRKSIDLGDERSRRYSAGKDGTAKNLKDYSHLLPFAKEILQEYIGSGERFGIRLGEQDERMRFATLVGNIGVMFSVRDKEQKKKIAHNLTVINPEEARRYREIFEEQWEKGIPLDDVSILDELMKEEV